MRHDFAPRGVANRLGTPTISYPTPNIEDLMIVEDVEMSSGYSPIVLGTPRPGDATSKLAWQGDVQGDGIKRMVRRIYVRDRAAQDAYNARIGYAENDDAFPIYTRTYIELRHNYLRGTDGSALAKVITISVNTGGTGYTSAPTLTFSGGGGSVQATAIAEVQDGVIVAVQLTSCGAGYTSVPSIAVGGPGTGGAVTCTIQASAAILIAEEAVPAPGELSGLYYLVTRVYETLPGPSRILQGYDQESLADTQTIRQRVVASTATKTALDTVVGEYSVVDCQLVPTESTVVYEKVTELFETPDAGNSFHSRTQYKSVGFQFPAIFNYLDSWPIPPVAPLRKMGPFPGVDYDLLGHRSNSKPGELVTTWHVGLVAAEETYEVHTPGVASREFPIGQNTIHDSWTLTEDHGGSDVQTIEDIDASTPSTYTPGTTECVVQSAVVPYRGNIFKKTVLTVVEN